MFFCPSLNKIILIFGSRNSNLIQKTHEETTTILLSGGIGTDGNSSTKLQRVERPGSEFRKPLRYAH